MSSTETADVIVVGGGAAGLAAAIEAASAGASVILLEKATQFRGTTGLSIGSISSSCTPEQKRLGIVDSPQEHFEDMAKFAGAYADRDNVELARIIAECMPETMRWLRQLGLEFYGPIEEPPHRKPRMHLVLPNSGAYIHYLLRRARALGVCVRLAIRAQRLVFNGRSVTGVEAERDAERIVFSARRGVVLAGGDFSNNPDFKREFRSEEFAGIPAWNELSTGDCQRMAREIGAVVVNSDYLLRPNLRFLPPPNDSLLRRLPANRLLTTPMRWALQYLPGWLIRPFALGSVTVGLGPERALFEQGALLVDKRGKLIRRPGEDVGFAIAQQAKEGAYIVFDKSLFERFSKWPHFLSTAPGVAYAYMQDYRRHRRDIYAEAADLSALATMLGMEAAQLGDAVREHNAIISTSPVAQSANACPILVAPFVALGPVRAWILFTNSGLKVSPSMQVLRSDSSVIHGLYAAGSSGQGGLLLAGHGHHLAWAFTSGRIAGRHAASMASSDWANWSPA